jgi:hypothetical protein
MESVEATLSLVKPDGTTTEPVPFDKFVKTCNDIIDSVDHETGEIGQLQLGNDPAFVRPTRRRDVPTVKGEWWEHEGRIGLKVVEIGSLQVTDREWSFVDGAGAQTEMQAEIERLQGVNQTYRILVEELREEIERLRAEYAQTLTAIATAISLTADIPNETAAALCRMCNRNLAALEGEE